MTAEKHVLDLLPAYALGSLEEAEAGRVGAHLAGCGRCQRELAGYQSLVETLGTAAPPADPPRDLKRRLMRRIHNLEGERAAARGSRPVRLSAWGMAGLALILILAVGNVFLWQRAARPGVLTGPQGMRAVALQAAQADAIASGIVIISADGQDGVLVVDELPQLPEGQQYQVWLFRDGQSTAGPAFSVDESGYRGVRILAPESLLSYQSIQVTVEPGEGSLRPSGTVVLAGSLHNP
jgi:anti-sigma-K factor RskA